MTACCRAFNPPATPTSATTWERCGCGRTDSTSSDAFHGIVDLHALTVTDEPGVIGERTVELAAILFAVGLDPDVATVFVQSHVPEHSQLAWVMECTVVVRRAVADDPVQGQVGQAGG